MFGAVLCASGGFTLMLHHSLFAPEAANFPINMTTHRVIVQAAGNPDQFRAQWDTICNIMVEMARAEKENPDIKHIYPTYEALNIALGSSYHHSLARIATHLTHLTSTHPRPFCHFSQ
ncbi:hypothetical protein DMENIID0001_150470 [Sergentomyia squamirostris]